MTDHIRPVAWRPLALVAGAVGVVLFALSGRYGYHRDELYYLAAGRHLAWGYDDQPPVVPALARLADELARGDLFALRLPGTLASAGIVLLTGLIAREMGGDRRAQVLAAGCAAGAPVLVIAGHLLSTTPLDILLWTVLAFLLVRWIRTRDDRLLYALGPIAGIALLTKNLVTVFLVALLAGILVAGPRELLTRRPLWISAVVAALMWAPNVWWQATHGWPQLEMTAVIREDADWGGRLGLLPVQPLLMAVSLTPVWIAGLWRLLRNPQARPWRALAVAYLVVLGIVLLTGGREYYPAGAYPALIASGAIATIGWLDRAAATARTVRGGLIAAAIALAAIGAAVTGLPIYPASSFAGTPEAAVNYDAGETIGWPEFAATVAGVYGSLPESERPTVVILTGNYGQAGALERYGERLGLPAPYSGQLAYWRWGPPPDTATGPVIVVGSWTDEDLLRYCRTVTREATNDNGYGVDNEEQGLPIRVCRGMIRPWSQIWPELRHL